MRCIVVIKESSWMQTTQAHLWDVCVCVFFFLSFEASSAHTYIGVSMWKLRGIWLKITSKHTWTHTHASDIIAFQSSVASHTDTCVVEHLCRLSEMSDSAAKNSINSNSHLKSSTRSCLFFCVTVCLKNPHPLCGFYFSVSLFSLPHSMERGLQRHHSSHVSTEIHLSTLSQSNISIFLPSGKIKYLVLYSEIHSEVP